MHCYIIYVFYYKICIGIIHERALGRLYVNCTDFLTCNIFNKTCNFHITLLRLKVIDITFILDIIVFDIHIYFQIYSGFKFYR